KTDTDQLTLAWSSSSPARTIPHEDWAGLNVIKFTGAQDGPAYGTYNYAVQGDVIWGELLAADWTATGGSVINHDPDNRTATIAWNDSSAGPGQGWLGNAILDVDGFNVVGALVNVVNVVVTSPDAPT